MTTPDPHLTAWLAAHDAPCPGCGYNLRGVAAGACPECGEALRLALRPGSPKHMWFVWALTAPFLAAAYGGLFGLAEIFLGATDRPHHYIHWGRAAACLGIAVAGGAAAAAWYSRRDSLLRLPLHRLRWASLGMIAFGLVALAVFLTVLLRAKS